MVVLLLTPAWVADWLDGPLARSAGRTTWLGRYDFPVGVTVLRTAPVLLTPFALLLVVFAIARMKRLQRQIKLALADLAAVARGCNESPSQNI